MNGQTRSSEFTSKDYSKLNLVKQVKVLENYKGYSKIYYIKPFINTHFAYLDGMFMGFTVPAPRTDQKYMDLMFMDTPEQAIDHYHKTIHMVFRNPGLEYSQFFSKDEFRPYIQALKFKMDSDNKKNGNKN